jgi:hypothetical protein
MKTKAKSKTEYLSYIEETPKHRGKLVKAAKAATSKAIREAKSRELDITYTENGNIIREDASGNKEVIGKIDKPRRKVRIGEKATL